MFPTTLLLSYMEFNYDPSAWRIILKFTVVATMVIELIEKNVEQLPFTIEKDVI